MKTLHPVILGGDPFSNVFRGLYNLQRFWKLTDPEYCLNIMQAAYAGGARAFDLSFPENVELFCALQKRVDEQIFAYGNPTYLQGTKLHGRDLQYLRDRIVKTIVEEYLSPELVELFKHKLKEEAGMVFGYDAEADALTEQEVADIYLDEKAFARRLEQLACCKYIMLGGTDADWLFSLQRADVIRRMVAITRQKGYIPLLICHYASEVLPKAEEISLDVEGYVIPLNKEWSWFTKARTLALLQRLTKPVISFMGLGSGGLRHDIHSALEFLFKDCKVSGILFGTSKPENAYKTTKAAISIYNATGDGSPLSH